LSLRWRSADSLDVIAEYAEGRDRYGPDRGAGKLVVRTIIEGAPKKTP
jgi:hypothetical protein